VIDVVGMGARGWPDIPTPLQSLIKRAEVVLGSPRHLKLVPAFTGQQREVWPSPLREGLTELVARFPDRRIVALASGDPLVAGIGSTLVDILGVAQVRIHTAPSSVALARARMGWSNDSVEVIRLRGDDVDLVRRAIFPARRLIILSRDSDSPAEIAAVLTQSGFGESRVTVLGDLESDVESRVDSLARDRHAAAPALNVVCVDCIGPGFGSLAPGLPDQAFDHDGQLTKRDVRASALAHLMPRPGQLLWDIGAGAGSIAIEWLRCHPSCRAVAVEQQIERAKRIQANARALGVPGLSVVNAEAEDILDDLPRPDAVFIGGGSTSEMISRCWKALADGGRMVVHSVTQETEMIMAHYRREHGGELTRISVEHLEPIGRYTGWQPARPVVQWSAIKESG
jgi:precorrin-6Y C5,15-methyltransferase (decarboxylating)